MPTPNWEERIASSVDLDWKERIALLVAFVEHWAHRVLPLSTTPEAVPGALREFYASTGGSLTSILRENRVLSPVELQLDESSPIVFAVENQCVYEWAYEETGDDPEVLGHCESSDPWGSIQTPMSLFLLEFMILELIWGAPFGATAAWLPGDQVAAINNRMTRLKVPAWHWPAHPSFSWFAATLWPLSVRISGPAKP